MDDKNIKNLLKLSKLVRKLGFGKSSFFTILTILAIVAVFLFQNVLNKKEGVDKTPNPEVQGVSVTEGEFKVEKVTDGDTFEIIIDGKTTKVRLIGVNTPETVKPNNPVECFGKEASDYTKKVLTGQNIVLESDIGNTDKYGRLLRYAYLKNENGELKMFNKQLVEEGYAYASSYAPNVKYQEIFSAAEKRAREDGKGLWKECGN